MPSFPAVWDRSSSPTNRQGQARGLPTRILPLFPIRLLPHRARQPYWHSFHQELLYGHSFYQELLYVHSLHQELLYGHSFHQELLVLCVFKKDFLLLLSLQLIPSWHSVQEFPALSGLLAYRVSSRLSEASSMYSWLSVWSFLLAFRCEIYSWLSEWNFLLAFRSKLYIWLSDWSFLLAFRRELVHAYPQGVSAWLSLRSSNLSLSSEFHTDFLWSTLITLTRRASCHTQLNFPLAFSWFPIWLTAVILVTNFHKTEDNNKLSGQLFLELNSPPVSTLKSSLGSAVTWLSADSLPWLIRQDSEIRLTVCMAGLSINQSIKYVYFTTHSPRYIELNIIFIIK